MTKVAVAGGTGFAGRRVTELIREAGGTPVVLARSTGFDLTGGDGLDEALRGVSTIIDVSNTVTFTAKKSIAFFETVTRNLLTAAARAGVAHFVALSIVGIDRVPLGYYAGKLRQEELVLSGPVPCSVLRATQFYEFADRTLLQQPGPFTLVPKMLCQPIAAREVAGALVELASGAPAGRVPDIAGPDQHTMPDMVRRLARARGARRLVIPFRVPGAAGKAALSGGLVPDQAGPRGVLSFEDWLQTDARAS
ncbi:3-beta hydroxysteroid dehydrogenase [Dactylosporangium sp. NBC_01737]|uniref:SDR family oxidoreductase n=1 Tax=Dactylosporangium sp. NBC_01737 TaxID=2975959 RepID=UPI002E0E5BF7|nr:3-beta hydroxysteroid dehydrogenase [Dactylosporangium sp. NBC_01737]